MISVVFSFVAPSFVVTALVVSLVLFLMMQMSNAPRNVCGGFVVAACLPPVLWRTSKKPRTLSSVPTLSPTATASAVDAVLCDIFPPPPARSGNSRTTRKMRPPQEEEEEGEEECVAAQRRKK
jgi:hypothetical protein